MGTITSLCAALCRIERRRWLSPGTGRSFKLGRRLPIPCVHWTISTREFRENLEWAVVVPGEGEISPAVAKLLDELRARGITIHDSGSGDW